MQRLDPKSLYRYDINEKIYYIDIHLDYYRDVYSTWDYSPMVKRSIDDDLIEYLTDCSLEIPYKKKIVINFNLPYKIKDIEREKKSIMAIHNYFTYIIRKTGLERTILVRNSALYFIIGISLLICAFVIQAKIKENSMLQIIPEGLLIGAWVVMWEIFSIIFFQLSKLNKKLRHYRRLQETTIVYDYR